jgi:Ycf66 protein N-terminus
MLAHILAVLVGTGSLGLYIAAFFFPEIHRKQDFLWSGVGFFYALSLWIYARQTTGGVLIGETASVALLGWFVWQTLKLRRQLVPTNQQTPIPSTSKIQQQLGLKPKAISQPTAPTKSKPTVATIPEPATPKPNITPAEPTPVAGIVDRSQPKSPPVVPPTPSAPNMRVPVEVRVERKPPQPGQSPIAVPTVPTPAEPPVVRATIPAPVTVPVEPQPQKTPTVATPIPTIPTAVVPAPVVVPVELKQPPPAPTTVPAVPQPEDEAWIKLEVKPSSSTPSKPIGQAAKPPTTPPTQPAQIASESVTRTAPTDPESSPKLDPESSNN